MVRCLLCKNVDRTARNPNLLLWHRSIYFIDHGAALYFHHNWETAEAKVESRFVESRDHVLLPWASAIPEAAREAHRLLSPNGIAAILELVPDEWLSSNGVANGVDAGELRDAYLGYLTRRLAASAGFEEEAIAAYERLR